jgi:5-methylcytosine-specific restriction protein A
MPTSPGHNCGSPGCPTIVKGQTYCAIHARLREKRRGTAQERGYTATWNALSKSFRLRHPLCEDCKAATPPRLVKSRCVDHVISKAKGGTDSEDNLRALCWACHNRKTNREDGGFVGRNRIGAIKNGVASA